MFNTNIRICANVIHLLMLILLSSSEVYSQDFPDRFLNGKIGKIHSEILQEDRILFIYLPENYEVSGDSYPVHYVTDAPATSNIFYSLLRLHSLAGQVPESIIVGLSSDNREVNLHAEKGADKYLEFLTDEALPYIESNFRTKPFRSISGHSLGGGFAIHAFLSRPGLFKFCLAGSPYPLEILSDKLEIGAGENRHPVNSFLYSTTGSNNDIDVTQFEKFSREFREKFHERIEFHFGINEPENHMSNLAVNFQNGLLKYYSGWKFVLPDTLHLPVEEVLARHYKSISEKAGYTVLPGEWSVLYPVMDQLAKRGDFASAVGVLKYCLELYPDSDQAHAFMAQAYLSMGNRDAAIVNMNKALSLNPENQFALHLKKLLK